MSDQQRQIGVDDAGPGVTVSTVTPFIRWPGSKRRALPKLRKFFPKEFGCYYEPMVGSGAVFFDLAPKRAVLADLNPRLMQVYVALRCGQASAIERALAHHYARDSEMYYYEQRKRMNSPMLYPSNSAEQSALFLYLNDRAFNGLWRVNKAGEFNVPYDATRKTSPNYENLYAVEELLSSSNVHLRNWHYREALVDVARGDFVYLDPPFYPCNTSKFTAYGPTEFGPVEHSTLRDEVKRLDALGVKVMLSNSSALAVEELYKGFNLHRMQVRRTISADPTRRTDVQEMVITNYAV